MSKQLNVNLAFTADTSQAKAQLQSLQTSLTQLISSAQLQDQGLGISKELQHSITLSSQLKSLLASATNMETGKLDLGKFNEGLQKSGTSLQTYSNALNSLGVQGQQAFSQLASSILQAELPLKRSNALLGQFMTTLKNTARWQISSSLLHGFMGAVQSAYGYAQDLNESLNNIRIVTGQNVDQMAKFAEKANQAAKALSASTTEYTNASLIYYQQGLSDSEVQERTDVTIKMANVSRQSAEIVSDQMTAVWNNFYDGGKSLEYYADVMTALGAATASSSDEIAGGLEKFAAIGETIGLSYEYAASALATITANTRQSEEVVGTALKTIFARIQGLKLGETLEDGVELNKYSEALQTIGISIFEQNGELKKMDNILNEMGAKWDTLSKAQQTALAQTVAGVRQYNQLISLMDNWDDMQKNLDISYNAEGALQEQADTYAESWEAASKRVKASAEGIYQTLLNDKFFIGVNNAFAELLQLIDNTIDSFGGLPGVLFMLGSVITSVFGTQITQSFDNFIYRIKMSTEIGKQSILQLRQQANDLLITNNVDMASTSGNAAANAYRQQGIVQNELIAKAEQLSEIERQQAQFLLDGHSSLAQQTVALGVLVEQEERRTMQLERSVIAQARAAAMQNNPIDHGAAQMENVKIKIDQLKNLEQAYYNLSTVPLPKDPTQNIDKSSMTMLKNIINELEQEYGDLINGINNKKVNLAFGKDVSRVFAELKQGINEGKISADQFNLIMDKLATSGNLKIRKLTQAFMDCGMTQEEARGLAERLATQYDILGDRTAELTESQIRLNNATKNLQNFLGGMKNNIQSFGAGLTSITNVLSSFGMMMMSIKGIVDTLNNTEMSFGDKFFTIFTQMMFLLPSVMHSVTQLTTLLGPSGFIGAMIQSNAVLTQTTASYGAATMAVISHQVVKNAEKMSIDKEYASRMILWVAQKLNKSEEEAETIIKAILTKQTLAKNAATTKEIALEIAKKAIKAATNPIMLATVAITAALTAAIWAFVYASQAEERALQAAKESVDNTARAYEDAENAVTKFKETASDYTEAIKGMKDLAYGTAEYAEKLREANDAAIELIKNNPELKYDVQSGLIQFEGGLDALEALEKQLMNQTYNAKMFNIEANIDYEQRLNKGKIGSELEKKDIFNGVTISLEPVYSSLGDKFITKLSTVSEAEKQGIMQSNEAIVNILKNEMPSALETDINNFANRISELSDIEKQDLINLADEISQNTVALQAETAALLQEEYGQKNVDQYGEAEVYATKSAILNERASTAWTHEDHAEKKVGFAEYLDDDLNWGNNISSLSKENQELLAKIMGKSVEDITNGEIRISNDRVEVSTGKDASNTMLPSMSVEDFNKAALNMTGQATVTWEEISAKLDTEEGRLEAQQYAKESGLYSADDLTIYDDSSSFKGLTYGTAKALETKFSDENGEVSGAIDEYFNGLDNTVKKRAAERLLQLDTTNLNAEQLDSAVKEITEKEAQQHREQQAKTELQTESAKYGLDYSTTEKQMGRVKETLQDYNDELEKNGKLGKKVEKEGNQLTKGYGNLEKSSKDLTVANQRMNRGIATLGDNFEDWSKVLKTGDKTTLEYTEAMEGMKEAFADIYNVADSSLISDDFLENMDPEVMKQIADGNIEAIESMRMAMADDIVANIILNNDLTTAEGNTVTSLWQQAKAELDAMGDLTVGTHIEGTSEFVTKLNGMIESAKMTKDQVNSMLGAMGMSATLKTDYKETEMEVPTYIEHIVPLQDQTVQQGVKADGSPNMVTYTPVKKYSVPGPPMKVTGTQEVVSIETKAADGTSSGGGIDIIGSGKPSPSNTGRASNPSGGGSGSGKSPKENKPEVKKQVRKEKPKLKTEDDKQKAEDEIERYYKINNEIEDLNRELDQLSSLKDEAWGPNKIKAMDKEIAKLKQVKNATKQYAKEIEQNLAKDEEKAKGFGAIMDENGIISNYEELINTWTDELNAVTVDQYNSYEQQIVGLKNQEKMIDDEADADGSARNALQDQIEALEEERDKKVKEAEDLYDQRKKSIEQYEETRDLLADTNAEIEDQIREIMALNFEKLQYKLEIRTELNESDLADIEFKLEQLGENNVYNAAERIAEIGKQATIQRKLAEDQISAMQEAERLYQLYLSGDKENGISQEDYMTMIKESKEKIQEAELAIRQGIQDVKEELISAFDVADERFDKHFAKYDELTELVEHYKTITTLTKGEAAFGDLATILTTSQEILKNRIEDDKKEIATWKAAREKQEAYVNSLSKDDPRYQAAKDALDDVMEKEAEANSQLMADIEQLGELARAVFENTIEKVTQDFEEAMFGRSLSSVIESMEMMRSKQEELLTTTNKLYETNKMLRDIEKDIEATTNNRAKQAYNEFAAKVKQKQEQNQLSKFELELLTAEYEITKAQIALEEAQNAKEQVRLTRDSEGNYGYVYTANQDKIADAQQKLADAENNYYNTALEGAQKYQEQMYQHIEEWQTKIKEVYLDQTLSEEEKNRRIKEIDEIYNTLILQDQELFYVAKDALIESSYENQAYYSDLNIRDAEKWFHTRDGYLKDLQAAQVEYDKNTAEVRKHTVENFGSMAGAMQTAVEKSGSLNSTMNILASDMRTNLIKAIGDATTAWSLYADQLRAVIELQEQATKKSHDTMLKEIYKEDYAAQIQQLLAGGADANDYDVRTLAGYRWEKMGGVDNTDYQALIDAGGTPEQIALWTFLRDYKIDNTDWKAYIQAHPEAADWASVIRDTKLDQDYASKIVAIFKSSQYARWSDSEVQKLLRTRADKIKELHLEDEVQSNEELKSEIAAVLHKNVEELKTGGYTGDWGPEGRLALLHEKELVLNKDDTKNFLTATNILREISQMLDNNALVASLGMINLNAMTIGTPADQVLQQEVTIHADFPNVTDHNEIEIAIDNLINAASQYAYKS